MGKDVIVALDFDSKEKTLAFLDRFTEEKPFVKIGMELFYAEGPSIVREIKARGHKIFLDLKLHDLSCDLINFGRHGIQLRLDHRTGFIDKVDRFIRKETICNVPVGKYRCTYQCTIRDLNSMEHLVPLLDSSKDRYCIFNGWLIHHNRLETSLKSRILLYILSVLVQCCGTYTVQLTSGEHRLKHVSRIHCTISLACSHNGVKLIDEHNHFTLRLLNLIKDILKSLFKFTSVLGTGHKSSHIKCKYLLDPLKVIKEDKVKLQMSGSLLPMKIVPCEGDAYTYLVLPVRLAKE